MKICPVAPEFFNADERTDRLKDTTTLIIVFSSFVNALKKERDTVT
jgi:hypothetical protein